MYDFHKGDHVFVTLSTDETYEGLVQSFSKSNGRLSLKDITKHPDKSKILGVRHFYDDEILKIKIFQSSEDKDNVKEETTALDLGSPNGLPSGSPNDSPKQTTMKVKQSVYEDIKRLQSQFRFINKTDNNFYHAVKMIQNSSELGVWVVDVCRGRKARATLLAIATASNVVVFDLLFVGDVCFDKGLRAALESEDVVKVVHDSRLLADCLLHKHLVRLRGVRDVEAEDLLLHQQRHGKLRTRSKTLEQLVEHHLGLSHPLMKLKTSSESEGSWSERPLSEEKKADVAAAASLLIPLHRVIEHSYLEKLRLGSREYCEALRDRDNMEASLADTKHTLYKKMRDVLRFTTCDKQVNIQ